MSPSELPSGPAPDPDATEDAELASVLEACLAEFEAGRPINLEQLEAKHPAIAPRLRACLASMRLVEHEGQVLSSAAGALAPAVKSGQLGDYRLLREIGRGGMGIVYEAEQVSLGRRVAIKVLPLAASLDPRGLQRFRTEVQAAAQLQHPHIVPVYTVGCVEETHFFVMQFIDGRTIADLIHGECSNTPLVTHDGLAVPQPLPLRTTLLPGAPGEDRGSPASTAGTSNSSRSPPRNFREIARLTIQAAKALDHAHEMGIVHRDVKPANLLLDGRGHLWVTDFGLALLLGDTRLTQSGDVVGTLRYMAPEQAAARRGLVDHRADIYGLGATLYEWLTLRPVLEGGDRAELLRHLAVTEPVPVSRLNSSVPRDLETIVHKAIAKAPDDRYPTAEEMADDLQRFLDDEPVWARRPTLGQRGAKWAWRNRKAVVTAMAFLLVLVIGLAASVAVIWQAKGQTEQALWERTRARDDLQAALDREQQTAYRHAVALADQLWLDGNVARADELLTGCVPSLRRWEWHYVRRLCRTELVTVRSFSAGIGAAAVSPDGRWLAVSGRLGGLRLHDAATGDVVGDFPDYANSAWHLAFDPSSEHLAILGLREVQVRRVADRSVVWSRAGGPDAITVAYSHAGRLLAAAEGRTTRLLDARTGEIAQVLPDLATNVKAVAAGSRAGAAWLVAALGQDGGVKVWNEQGAELASFAGRTLPRGFLAFSPNGQRLLRGNDVDWQLMDLTTRKTLWSAVRNNRGTTAACFSPDGRQLAAGGADRLVRLFDVETGRQVREYRGHSDAVTATFFRPDGRLVSTSYDGTAKVWDGERLQGPRALRGQRGVIHAIAFSPDGTQLASASEDGTIKLFDPSTGRELRTLAGHTRGVLAVAFSPNGRQLASAGTEGRVLLWDLTRNEVSRPLIQTMVVRYLAFSPDGALLAGSGSRVGAPAAAGEARLWKVESGEEVQTFTGERSSLGGIAFSPDGRRFIWRSEATVLSVVDLGTGRVVLRRRWKGGERAIAVSPDGQRIAAPGRDRDVCVWELSESTADKVREPSLTLRGHSALVIQTAFSPDGRRLAAATMDGTVKLWEAGTDQEVLTLRPGGNTFSAVAFSPDGRRLAAGGYDMAVHVWDGTPLP